MDRNVRRISSEQYPRPVRTQSIRASGVAEAGAVVGLEVSAARHHNHCEDLTSGSCGWRRCLHGCDDQLGGHISLGSGRNCTAKTIHEGSYKRVRDTVYTRFFGKYRVQMGWTMRPAVFFDECNGLTEDSYVDRSALASRVAIQVSCESFHANHPVVEGPLVGEQVPKLEFGGEGLLLEVMVATDSLRWAGDPRPTTKQDRIDGSDVKAGVDAAAVDNQFFSGIYMAQFSLSTSIGAAMKAQLQSDTITARRSMHQARQPMTDSARALADALQFALAQGHKQCFQTSEAEPEWLSVAESWQVKKQTHTDRILNELYTACVTAGVTRAEQDVKGAVPRIPLDARRTGVAAFPQLFAYARKQADGLVAPKTRHVKLHSSTLRTPEEVNAWVVSTGQELLEQLRQGPIVMS